MINLVESVDGYLAVFKRGDYLTVRGTGQTRTEALVNLRAEVEAMLMHDERMVAQGTDAVDSIDGLLG